WSKVIQLKIESNPEMFKPAFATASDELHTILGASAFPEMEPDVYVLLPTFDSTNTYYEFRSLIMKILTERFDKTTGQSIYGLNENQLKAVQDVLIRFNDAFDYMPADKAMEFLADDDNLENGRLFILPSRGLTIPVDKKKALESGIVDER